MERRHVEQVVVDFVKEQLGTERVPLEAHFFDELGGDSLDYAEVAMELDDHFDISLPDATRPNHIHEIAELVWETLKQGEQKRSA